jgi:hypothetical protein
MTWKKRAVATRVKRTIALFAVKKLGVKVKRQKVMCGNLLQASFEKTGSKKDSFHRNKSIIARQR